jgi:hypothetical protein
LIYHHDGASKTDYIKRALEACNRYALVPGYQFDVSLQEFDPDDPLDRRALDGFDVLLISGGWVDTFHPSWVAADIRDFVRNGGGYVGICAGEILAIEGVVDSPFFGHYEGLEIAPAVVRESPQWVGGRNIRLTETGARELGVSGDQRVLHWNGSILRYRGAPPVGSGVLAVFAGNGPDPERQEHGDDLWNANWNGQAAILSDVFGRGRVMLCAPHPEHPREDARYQKSRLIGNMVRWAYGAPATDVVAIGREEILPRTRVTAGVEALSAHIATAMQLETLRMHLRSDRGRGTLGVYSDEDGKPGRLLASTDPFVLLPDGGWIERPLRRPLDLSAGDTVWLAWRYEESVRIAVDLPEYPSDAGATRVAVAEGWDGEGLPAAFPPDHRLGRELVSVAGLARPDRGSSR